MADNIISEFSMFISKSSLHNGEMRWSAINSDTDWDLYGERMSLELYRGMLTKIKSNTPPPEQFAEFVTSEYWKGGMPYLSIAHYQDGNGKAVPGDVRELFIDGKQLKAKGTLHDTKLGRAVWKSLKEDELNYKNSIDTDRIRISIAFLDLAHKHGESGKVFHRNALTDLCPECQRGVGEKIYLDGYLVHLALTRVPVNPRTIMLPEDELMAKKSKPVTKMEDAVAVVGDAGLVEEEVVKSNLEAKSLIEDAMVEMSDATPEEAPVPVEEPKNEPEVVEAKSGDYAEVAWRPYGGAVSMKEAKKFVEAQQESWRVSDLYYTFSEVARNIMDSDEVTDKAGALASLVDEFKKSLVAKALYEELSQIRSGVLEENYMTVKRSEINEVIASMVSKAMDEHKNPKKGEEAAPQKSDTVSTEVAVAEKSALEESVEKLYNVVNAVIGRAGTKEDKLKEVQPVLELVGQEIVNVVGKSVGETPVETPPMADAVLEAIQSLNSKIDAIGTEVATLKAQSINVPTQENRVPAPRSITPTIVKSDTPSGNESPNSVRNIVRRSVGL